MYHSSFLEPTSPGEAGSSGDEGWGWGEGDDAVGCRIWSWSTRSVWKERRVGRVKTKEALRDEAEGGFIFVQNCIGPDGQAVNHKAVSERDVKEKVQDVKGTVNS